MEADPSIGWELLIILILIIANGLFAMTEIAIVSSRKTRLEKQAQEGSSAARTAWELANEPTQLLSTVQVGISVIGVVTGATAVPPSPRYWPAILLRCRCSAPIVTPSACLLSSR